VGEDKALFLKPNGVNMPISRFEAHNLIKPEAFGEFLRALEDKKRMLEVGQGLRVDVALKALSEGISLTEILRQAVWQLEKHLIAIVLESTNGNKAQAARLLKIDYKTLYRKMHKYVI
jgi:DNA-binding NtrC family response regulator